VNKPPRQRAINNEEGEESEDEWEEVDPEEELVGETTRSLTELNVHELASDNDMDDDDSEEELDPSCCFMCDLEHDTIESCMVHMHKQHGFFIPDVEYLKDAKGLLTYLGLKVLKHMLCSFLL
jgi:pre-60S factor REI1